MSSIKGTQKRRGRHATVGSPRVPIGMPPELISAVDAYAEAEEITRSEAVPMMIEYMLEVSSKEKQ